MVNRGVPSTACERCRSKRRRCDRKPEGCGNCARAGQICDGYRSALDLLFHDQTATAARMVHDRVCFALARQESRRDMTDDVRMRTCRVSLARPSFGQYTSAHLHRSPSQIQDLVQGWLWRYDSQSAFDTAQSIWVKPYWPMAMDVNNEAFFQCVSLLSLDKKRQLTTLSPSGLYLAQKGHVLQQIRREIERDGAGVSHQAILAVCGMAYCEIVDGRIDIAIAHFRGLGSTRAYTRLGQAEWLFVAWTDLRFAIYTRRRPLLRYYVPASVRDDELQQCRNPDAYGLASRFVSLCPNVLMLETVFTSVFDVFVKFYELTLAFAHIEHTSQPPFRQLYDLEYKLRWLLAQVETGLQSNEDPQLCYIFVVLSALQLQVWIISHRWTPTRTKALSMTLASVHGVLTAMSRPAVSWQMEADLASLIWSMVSILSCTAHAGEHLLILTVLNDALNASGIQSLARLKTVAEEWPIHPGKREQWLDDTWSAAEQYRAHPSIETVFKGLRRSETYSNIDNLKKVVLGPFEFLDV